jgi:hypothetical protein
MRVADDVAFQIVNNIFFKNGQADKTASGGLNISVNAKMNGAPANQLDFNTFSNNHSGPAAPTTEQGISCIVGTTMKANNNIIWDNGDLSVQPQVNPTGLCDWEYSDIGPIQTGVGSTNMNMPPKFVDEVNGDLHLTATSPVRGAADPQADLSGPAARDFDGDARTGPADMGADTFTLQH